MLATKVGSKNLPCSQYTNGFIPFKQHTKDKNGKHAIKPIVMRLTPSSFPLIGPNYKLVIRDDTMKPDNIGIDKKIENHTRVPLPNCLFNGTLFDNDQVQVAISTCGSSQKKVVLVSYCCTCIIKFIRLWTFQLDQNPQTMALK